MSTDVAPTQQNSPPVPAVAQPRLPYHPGVKERFGIGQAEWRALVESTFPTARSVGAVILALSYCKARGLDPFKKCVHIVPIWDSARRCEVETVWPGIAEYRTTAARTASYAGHDEVAMGPMHEETWQDTDKRGNVQNEVTVSYPEWAQMTVYRLVQGERCAFPGPRVYWRETYAAKKNGCPNSMWAKRPMGMIAKCAEAASLRGAVPEELGGEPAYEEWGGFRWHGRASIDTTSQPAQLAGPPSPDALANPKEPTDATPPPDEEPAAPASEEAEVAPPETTPTQDALPSALDDWKPIVDSCGSATDVRQARKYLDEDTVLSAEQKAEVVTLLDAAAKKHGGRRRGKPSDKLPGMEGS